MILAAVLLSKRPFRRLGGFATASWLNSCMPIPSTRVTTQRARVKTVVGDTGTIMIMIEL